MVVQSILWRRVLHGEKKEERSKRSYTYVWLFEASIIAFLRGGVASNEGGGGGEILST